MGLYDMHASFSYVSVMLYLWCWTIMLFCDIELTHLRYFDECYVPKWFMDYELISAATFEILLKLNYYLTVFGTMFVCDIPFMVFTLIIV